MAHETFVEFCAPVREELVALYGASNAPRVSIVLAAHNEESELLATLVSYSCLNVLPGEAELVVVDNASDDRTAGIIRAAGARYVHCAERGVGYAKRAGVAATSPRSEYIWLSDADVRVVRPFRTYAEAGRAKSSVLRTNVDYLDANPNVLGLSSGGTLESAHWSYWLIHRAAVALGWTRAFSCWSGWNQFVRRDALEAIGGIDPDVLYWEDQHRHYELARYGKRTGRQLESANRTPALLDPVYQSGRRYATARLVARQVGETIQRSRRRLPRDEYGYPVHPKGVDWRRVRADGRG